MLTHNKLRAENRQEKKAKYIEDSEKLLRQINMIFYFIFYFFRFRFRFCGIIKVTSLKTCSGFTLTFTCRRKRNLFFGSPYSGFLFYTQVLQQEHIGSDLWFAHFYWSWSFRIIHS